MALRTSQTKTGYYVAKFEDSKANVFIYLDGYLGIRKEISINQEQRQEAEADLAIVKLQIEAEKNIFNRLPCGDGAPPWAHLFTPKPQDPRFAKSYSWYSFSQNTQAALGILLKLAPLGKIEG